MATAEELTEKYAAVSAGKVAFDCPEGGPSVRVTLQAGTGDDISTAALYLFGAHMTSWFCGRQRLWMSSLSKMDGTAPIRGGVPIAFPQFATQGPLPLHGFAREQLWKVTEVIVDETFTEITLQVQEDEKTLKLWDHKYTLQYKVRLLATQILLSLTVVNTAEEAWSFTGCLHTYFLLLDSAAVQLVGLKGTTFTDKVDDMKEKTEADDAIEVAKASADSNGFVDRIYKNSPKTLYLKEGSSVYQIEQSASFPDTVVFNPWEEGKKGDKHPDFDDDGYMYLLCVEPAIAAEPLTLKPGETFMGEQRITMLPIET